MTAKKNETVDLEAILPNEGKLDVEGIDCIVRRLKSREFLQLVRVLTTGLGPSISQINLAGDQEELQGQLIGMILMAIPEAADEFGDFVFSIVEPVNRADKNELREKLQNPELDVLIDVLTIVVVQEAPDFQSLVGKVKAALKLVQGTYRRPTGK